MRRPVSNGLFTPQTRRDKTVSSRLDQVSMSPRWRCEQVITELSQYLLVRTVCWLSLVETDALLMFGQKDFLSYSCCQSLISRRQ